MPGMPRAPWRSARKLRELLAEVASGAREQGTGIAQNTKTVQVLDTVTKQNPARAVDVAARR